MKLAAVLSGRSHVFGSPLGGNCDIRATEGKCDHYGGRASYTSCIALSDEQPHMVSPLRALLMLEAPVWVGAAAGSVCQRIRDRQGGEEGAEQLPPAPPLI